MTLASLFDGGTLAIVVGGTLLATLLRCGLADSRATLSQLMPGALNRGGFDPETLRARLARQLQDITRDGLLRAAPRPTGDAEFDAAIDALVSQRSLAAAHSVMADGRARRMGPALAAVRTLATASDLAPVFGLAGTLVSLSRLPANGVDRTAYMAAIGMAVHATLYGLVLANLVLMPLSRLVERRMTAQDEARRALADWMEVEVTAAMPSRLHHQHGHHIPPHHGPAHETEPHMVYPQPGDQAA